MIKRVDMNENATFYSFFKLKPLTFNFIYDEFVTAILQ